MWPLEGLKRLGYEFADNQAAIAFIAACRKRAENSGAMQRAGDADFMGLACEMARKFILDNERRSNVLEHAAYILINACLAKKGTCPEFFAAKSLLMDWLAMVWLNRLRRQGGNEPVRCLPCAWRGTASLSRGVFASPADIREAFCRWSLLHARVLPRAKDIREILEDIKAPRTPDYGRMLYEKRYGKSGDGARSDG